MGEELKTFGISFCSQDKGVGIGRYKEINEMKWNKIKWNKMNEIR